MKTEHINLSLPSGQRETALALFQAELDKVQAEIIALDRRKKELLDIITQLSGPQKDRSQLALDVLAGDYNPKGTKFQKITFVLNEIKRIASSKAIAEIIMDRYEPSIRGSRDQERDFIQYIASGVSEYVKTGKLRRIEIQDGPALYALPEWFEEGNQLKAQYIAR